jgi:hypothetical protein
MALITKLLLAIRIVLPSGVARNTASVPITVLAPERFSTIIVGPCARLNCSASKRATRSAGPPAAKGTTIRMVLPVTACAIVS